MVKRDRQTNETNNTGTDSPWLNETKEEHKRKGYEFTHGKLLDQLSSALLGI
jgi:hypothetical protein